MNFSVIIPLYNRQAYIAAAIESALAQELAPHQIIVVDDGSTDGGPQVVERFGDRVELYRQSNQGCAAARNLGIEHATGDYLAFLDSDDVWYPWALRLLAEAVEARGGPPLLATAMRPFRGETPLPAEPAEPVISVYTDLLSSERTFATSVLVARRDIVEQASGFVPINMNGTDLEFNLRVGNVGPMVVFESPPMLAYRKHATNVTNSLAGTVRGLDYMIEQEKLGAYPGGKEWQAKRREFITAQTRANSLAALRAGERDLAWKLYRKTFAWNLAQWRVRYLLGYWARRVGSSKLEVGRKKGE